MNVTAIMLLSACLTASAAGNSQSVTLDVKNAPLEKVFSEIKKQTGYSIFYNYKLLDNSKPVTVNVKDVSIEEVMKACLADQPLDYEMAGKSIVIKEKSTGKKNEQNVAIPPTDIHGRITDSTGAPLAGASVTVRGTRKGVVTDLNGNFEIKDAGENITLVISFTGYESQQVKFNGENVIVRLLHSTSQLDEVQIIAYGTQSQRLSVGDVTTIKSDDIEKQPINNPLLALEGRVPGMFITQTNGISGGAVKVQIRGQNSILDNINTTNDPLYILDGVPYPAQLLPGLNSILGSSGTGNGSIVGSPLSFINPSDIESISVLKDADATAIYGTRAANGAIIITTKKGKSGRTTGTLNLQNGWGKVGRRLDLMNTQEYLQMRHEALRNDGLDASDGDYDLNGTWDTTRYTDWQKTLLGGTAQYNNVNGSISGGNNNLQYLIGGTFHRETTVFSNDFSDQKASVHFNIRNTSANQKFQVQLTGSYLIDNNQLPGLDLTGNAMTFAPDLPALYTSDGQLNWAPDKFGNSTITNPLVPYLNAYKNKTNNLIANSILSYTILPGLNLSTSLGYSNLQSLESLIFPLTTLPPERRSSANRSANFGNNNINSWIVEPQLSYRRRFGKGSVEALLGSSVNQVNSNGMQLTASGQPSDQVLADIRSATNVTVSTTTSSVYKYNAAFGRIRINWEEKYLINLSARRDGSSRFGSANQFHDFGAVGAGWVFSNESFVQNTCKYLSFGKIRASYGTTGSDQIGDYQFMNLYSVRNFALPYQNSPSLRPNGLTNPYLQWQETKKLELGIDLGFLKDKILLNVNYFRNRSSNQLIGYPLPIITGFGSITKNLPAVVQNKGWEFSLSTTNIKTKDFTWISSINLSTYDNKLVSFPGYTGTVYIVGRPLNYAQVFHYAGVDPFTGIYQFSDGKDGLTSIPDTNFSVSANKILRSTPFYYGGFSNSIRYKGIQLDFLFQFVKQNAPSYFYGSLLPGALGVNQPRWVLNRWEAPGNMAPIQKYNSDYSLAGGYYDIQNSDAVYRDASYIRLKNVSLSWQLPAKWSSKAGMQNARIFMQGQNLLTITGYRGLDPETQSSSVLPPLRIFTFGIQATL